MNDLWSGYTCKGQKIIMQQTDLGIQNLIANLLAMEASLTSIIIGTDYWIESYNRLNMFGVPKKRIDIGAQNNSA